jgi:hypothetical protein
MAGPRPVGHLHLAQQVVGAGLIDPAEQPAQGMAPQLDPFRHDVERLAFDDPGLERMEG